MSNRRTCVPGRFACTGGHHRYKRQIRHNSGSYRAVERRVKELYITPNDVQTQRLIFFNIRLAPVLNSWYTFRKLRNR